MSDEQLFTLALDALRRGDPLSDDLTAALSHLESGELEALERVWAALDVDKKRGLLAHLSTSEQEHLRQDFNAVYRIALNDGDPAVRHSAVGSIVEDDSARLLDRLIELSGHDPAPSVREVALARLAPYALLVELGKLGEEWRPRLQDTLIEVVHRSDDGPGPRREALASLGYLDDDRVTEEIRRAFADSELQQWAVRAMGRTANPGWIPLLRQAARTPNVAMRHEVAVALGELADQRATKFVVDMVDDPVLDVRLAAVAALGAIGGDEARDGLLYALEAEEAAVREAAEQALVEIETGEDPLAL